MGGKHNRNTLNVRLDPRSRGRGAATALAVAGGKQAASTAQAAALARLIPDARRPVDRLSSEMISCRQWLEVSAASSGQISSRESPASL